MKILLDMNLSPEWISLLGKAGYETLHWRTVGNISAPDSEIMDWARNEGYIVFTHDLDYGALLYATKATSPSVIQLRSEDIRPLTVGNIVVTAIARTEVELLKGALVTIDPRKMRVTFLPLKKKN